MANNSKNNLKNDLGKQSGNNYLGAMNYNNQKLNNFESKIINYAIKKNLAFQLIKTFLVKNNNTNENNPFLRSHNPQPKPQEKEIPSNKINEAIIYNKNEKSNNFNFTKNPNERIFNFDKNTSKVQTNSKKDLNFLLDNNFNIKPNENKIIVVNKEAEKKSNLSFLDLMDEKDYNDKIFEISDFIPGRISEISNNIEKMDLEGTKKEKRIQRDFYSNQISIEEKTVKNNNLIIINNNNKNRNRLTIESIAKDIGLINDDIDYAALNELSIKNKEYFNNKKINNDSIKNPYLPQINDFNNEFAQRSDKKEIKLIKEEPKKPESKNAYTNKINSNPYFNRITQLGPFNKLEFKDSSDDISFSFEENQNKNLKNLKVNDPLINLEKMNPNPNSKNLNLIASNYKNFSSNYQAANNLNNNIISNYNNPNQAFDLNYNNKQETKILNTNKNTTTVPILKDPFDNPSIRENNVTNTNQPNAFSNNNNNNFNSNEAQANKDKNKKHAVVLPNKIFETNNKNNPNKDSIEAIENDFNFNILAKEALNKLGFEKKKPLPKKITIGLHDLNLNNFANSSENEPSKRTSEKNPNKFAKKRQSIKRNTLKFFKNKDFTQISSSSDDEKKNLKEEDKPEQAENNDKPHNLNKEEKNENNKMDICEGNKQLPEIKKQINKNFYDDLNSEEFDNKNAIDEAEEILKNLEKNVYNNNNNYNSKNFNNTNNPFLSAVKNPKGNLKENEDKTNDNNDNLNTPITPYKKDDYLLATPGKYFISNNSSKIKEKDFSKFTGFKPDFNLPSNKTNKLHEDIKNTLNLQMENNNLNPFSIVNNNNNNQKPKEINLLNLKDAANKQDQLNNRVTINRLINLNVDEENEESELSSFDDKKNNQILKAEKIEKDENQIDLNKNTAIPIIQHQEINQANLIKINPNNVNKNNNNNHEAITFANENNIEDDNKALENISFSQLANENFTDFNLLEEINKKNADIKAITKKVRERNNKLFEYLKEIFKWRFQKMKKTEKSLREKQEHLTTLKNQIENYKKEAMYYEKEMILIDISKKFFENFQKYYKFLSRNLLNTKVLGIEFNTLKLIFANTINVSFHFEELNHKMLTCGFNIEEKINLFSRMNNYSIADRIFFEEIKISENQRKEINKAKVIIKNYSFFFISNFMDELKLKDKIIEDPEINKVFKRITTYVLNMIFTNKHKKFYSMSFFDFVDGYKVFIETATNIVHLIKQFYLWDGIFNNVSLNFDEAKELLNMIFTINCTGYNLILSFTCEITDAFFGYDFIHYEMIKDYITENELAVEKNKIDKICENIKSFLESKHKLFNPYFFVNFIQNVKKKITENSLSAVVKK